MRRTLVAVGVSLLAIGAPLAFRGLVVTPHAVASVRLTPVARSLEAQRVIVPPPAGVGNKFPGEAAVYMGIVHVAMYDAAVAIQGRYRPYAIALRAPAETSPAAAIATAAHRVLVVLLPTQRGDLDNRYADYVSKLPDNAAKTLHRHCSFSGMKTTTTEGSLASAAMMLDTVSPHLSGRFSDIPQWPLFNVR